MPANHWSAHSALDIVGALTEVRAGAAGPVDRPLSRSIARIASCSGGELGWVNVGGGRRGHGKAPRRIAVCSGVLAARSECG